ncbi:purine permease 3-like [Andrographis paniculata]|uniref:purine permease 3-like n=1 Tax=Andrographis paniculata TaxID=175694 RepID=UPI0021E937AB|nr:purine permease 3-like [Andrographis paniculata]
MAAAAAAVWRKIFLILNCILLAVGNSGGPLIMRLYFVKGGARIWLSSFLQTAGFPIMLLPLAAAYIRRRRRSDGASATVIFMTPRVFLGCAGVGILAGISNYFYSYGLAKLPVSTSSLIVASQLVFTAAFAYFLVKQRFTAYSVNAVVLLTVGAAVLGMNAGGDRPEGVTGKEYSLGFALTVAAAAVAGLMLPVVELTYGKAAAAGEEISYSLVVEFQMTMSAVATVFSAVGMLINNDFQAISREAKQYELGEFKYYWVLLWTSIVLQCFFLGMVGVVFYASSLLSAIVITVTLPITQILAVVFYHENFHPEKGVSLFLTLWGFASYSYGEIKIKNINNSIDNNNTNANMDNDHNLVSEVELKDHVVIDQTNSINV